MNKGLFLLLKGAPNSGKSVAALSFPDPITLDFDRKGSAVAKKHFSGTNWENRYKTFNNVFELSDWMKPYLTGMAFPHETLILDTVTSLSTLVLGSIDKTKGTDVIEMMKQLTKSDTVEVMGIDYYNSEANFFERWFLSNIKVLWTRDGFPNHVILNAHEYTVESAPDLKTKLVTRTKSILTAGRKSAVLIPKAFDEEYVIKMTRPVMGDTLNRVKYLCYTSVNQDEDARTCYPFPEVIDFTNKSLYAELDKVAGWEKSREKENASIAKADGLH